MKHWLILISYAELDHCGEGGWMIAAGALGFVQSATRRTTSQPARKNLAAREGGREGLSRGGSKL